MLGEGVHAIAEADYHADPAPGPSLTRGFAKLLIDTSPAHVYATHPRLGGAAASDHASDEMDIGSAAHAMFLQGLDAVTVIPFLDYKSKAAKEARDAARMTKRVPLKLHHYERALRIVDALEAFRARTGAFTVGKPERALIWQEDACWYRAKVDWLPDDPSAPMWDLKTTSSFATERGWSRIAYDKGTDMQFAHYTRGAETLRGEPPDGMYFAVVEQSPPYGIRVFRHSPAGEELGQAKMAEARRVWAHCLQSGSWSPYPLDVAFIEPPSWEMRQWGELTVTGRALGMTHEQRAIGREAAATRFIEAGQFGG